MPSHPPVPTGEILQSSTGLEISPTSSTLPSLPARSLRRSGSKFCAGEAVTMQMGVDMRGPLFPKEQVPVSTPIPREVGTPFRWHDGFLSLATPHKVEARVRQRACQRGHDTRRSKGSLDHRHGGLPDCGGTERVPAILPRSRIAQPPHTRRAGAAVISPEHRQAWTATWPIRGSPLR